VRAHRPRPQRGAALLLAMLVVALVATLAAQMLWQQWRGVEVESAQRARVQASWVLTGALDWARLILREDARQGGADTLGEPWAVPLAPARLSTFLAAEGGQALVGDDTSAEEEAFLAGQIEDLQGRLNLTNLLDGGAIHAPTLAMWRRLFELLHLPAGELQLLGSRLLQAQLASTSSQPDQAGAPLLPQTAEQMVWLGLPAQTVQRLAPFVTVLPERTTVNLNTAALEVVQASVAGLDAAGAREWLQLRATQPLKQIDDLAQRLGRPGLLVNAVDHGVASRYFAVTGQLRLGQRTVQESSVVRRDGMRVVTLSRNRSLQTPARAQPASLE
jgi:general secretion pathway protein K